MYRFVYKHHCRLMLDALASESVLQKGVTKHEALQTIRLLFVAEDCGEDGAHSVAALDRDGCGSLKGVDLDKGLRGLRG